jgi:hypothetical protein
MDISIRYVVPGDHKPRAYAMEPPSGEPEISAGFESRTVPVRDLRPLAAGLSLDREGFRLVDAPTDMRAFDDDAAVRSLYYPEASRLVARETGASRVVVFDHTVRRRRAGAASQPVFNAHVDFTRASGPRRARDWLRSDPGELLRQRHAIINVWRPIVGPLRDSPLAVADAATVAGNDLVATDLVYPQRTGEYYLLKYNSAHRWYYAPAMQPHEVLLLKNYDSAEAGPARFSPHGAFEDPGMPPDAPPRASIELRTLAFFG